jgi:hypothetical protein
MLGVQSHLESWLSALIPRLGNRQGKSPDSAVIQRIPDLFEVFFEDCAQFVTNELTMAVRCSKVQLSRSLMRLFEA